jgi:PST family polysaccharide transporter
MLAFGGNLTGFGVINYFARNLDNALIGRYWGSQQLGLYGKAYQLLLLPIDQINAPITAVAVPVLSRLVDSPDRYRHAYLRILEKVAPLTATHGLHDRWLPTGWCGSPVVLVRNGGCEQALRSYSGVADGSTCICLAAGWLFISQARTNDRLRWGSLAEPSPSSLDTSCGLYCGGPSGSRPRICLPSVLCPHHSPVLFLRLPPRMVRSRYLLA